VRTPPGTLVASPGTGLAVALALCAGFVGCVESEEISTYTVPTHESLQTPEYRRELAARKPIPARMLAAIAPHDSSLWFFKLQGPPDEIVALEPAFRSLLKSLHFTPDGRPEWTLPDGWQERPGNELRYRTLVPGPQSPLELTVSMLPAGEDRTEALLANINRWRNQLDLPFIEADDLPQRTETLTVGEIPVTLINIAGKSRPAAAPMAGMAPRPTAPAAPPQSAAPGEIQFTKPAEWLAVAPRPFIQSAFMVVDGKKELLITVSRAGGSAVANVNRWRGQMGLDSVEEAEIAKMLTAFEAGDRPGAVLEMKSETQTLVAIMIPDGDQTVFLKLLGDPGLADQERQRFEEFARSVRF